MDSLDKSLVILKIYNMLLTAKYYISIKIFNLLCKIHSITHYMYNKQINIKT